MMKVPKSISASAARKIGDAIGVDWNEVDLEQFRKGIKVELEHGTELGPQTNVTGNDLEKTARIALAHLKELPDYYSRLSKIEERRMTKKELKKLVESIVEAELQNEDRGRHDSHPLFAPDSSALSKEELNAALQRQKEKKMRMDAQRKRAAIKKDLREEDELCEDYDRTDEAKQLLQELLPQVSSILEKSRQLETALSGTPGTENIRGAVEYHSEQLGAALNALRKRVR